MPKTVKEVLQEKIEEEIEDLLDTFPDVEFGPAHIVIADKNLRDSDLVFCLRETRAAILRTKLELRELEATQELLLRLMDTDAAVREDMSKPPQEMLQRFWVSWWAIEEDKPEVPFQTWISGYRNRDVSKMGKSYLFARDVAYCAVIDAKDGIEVDKAIREYYPSCVMRFIGPKEPDFRPDSEPGSRFSQFENRTRLK